MGGTRSQFDRALEAIEAKVIELFAMVAEDLPAATQALLGGSDLAGILAEREQVTDALYQEVEALAGRQLLLQAPVASDLRFLLSVLQVTPELERSHDLVMQIASPAGRIRAGGLSPHGHGLAERMGGLASGMWRQAADAWYARDRSAAAALGERDQEMDDLHASLTAELAAGRMTIPVTMDMTLVARCYHRLGAHAVNIARRVAYLAGPPGR
jgi:phosphate transport system protein